MSNFLYVRTKTQEFLAEEAEEGQSRTVSLGLSVRGPHYNQEEWWKKLEDTSPANETEGQTTKSASRTKLRENRHDSETFHNADVDVDAVDLSISSFWLHGSWFQNMRGERRSLNLSNMKLMPPP